jgi:DHA2 family multidrug resistance protein
MGNATSMFNLMRNLGGSFGIASATTYLFRREQYNTQLLGARVTALNPQVRAMARGIQSNMIAHGSDPATALHRAYGAIWGMVQRQAAMVSFVDTFLVMSVVFLLMLPLLLVMRKPRYQTKGGAMH